MELRELEHPPQLWHNSEISISVTTIVTHNRKLAATTNNKLTGLWNSLPKKLFLIATRSTSCQPATFEYALIGGRGRLYEGVA